MEQDRDSGQQNEGGIRHVLDEWANDAVITINKNLRIWRYSMIAVVVGSLAMGLYIVQKGATNNLKSVGDTIFVDQTSESKLPGMF